LYGGLWQEQRPVVDFVLGREASALFCEQRTGKTYITAAIVEQILHPEAEILGVVPLSNIETAWVRVLQQVRGLSVCRSWEEYVDTEWPRLLLVHFEAVPKISRFLVKNHWTLGYVDESQRLRSRNGKQSKAIGRIKDCERKLILTGTPIDKGLEDLKNPDTSKLAKQDPQELWAQFRFLDPTLFGTVWQDFDEEFLRPCGYKGKERRYRPSMLPEFYSRISPYIMRVTKTQVGIEPLRIKRAAVFLRGKQRQLYREMEEDFVTRLGRKVFRAPLKITQKVRLQQLTGGFITEKKGKKRIQHRVGSSKLKRLGKLLPKLQTPTVIFYKFKEELELILELLEEKYPDAAIDYISGQNRQHRTEILDDFQAGRIDYLVVQVRAGGTGVDLYEANSAAVYSCTHSYVDFDQLLSRLQVRGKEPIDLWLLYCKGTIDEDILGAIRFKDTVTNRFHRRVKKRQKR
jgi:hypothetical protein